MESHRNGPQLSSRHDDDDDHNDAAKSWVKKVRKGAKKLQFHNKQLQISDRGDMGVRNFHFGPKFPQNGELPAQKLVEKIFSDKKRIFRQAEI